MESHRLLARLPVDKVASCCLNCLVDLKEPTQGISHFSPPIEKIQHNPLLLTWCLD